MNTHSYHSESELNRRPATTAELTQAAEKLAGFQRISWREALGQVASAAFRLHHYRDVRTRMLYDALCEIDCAKDACESSDD